jgi:hypothetical protein
MSLTQYRHNAASFLCCLLYQCSCELDKVSPLSCVDIYSTRCGICILHVYGSLLPVCTCRVSCHCGIWYTWLYVDTRVPGRIYVFQSRTVGCKGKMMESLFDYLLTPLVALMLHCLMSYTNVQRFDDDPKAGYRRCQNIVVLSGAPLVSSPYCQSKCRRCSRWYWSVGDVPYAVSSRASVMSRT